MKTSTRILLYFASYSAKLMGTGIFIIGVGLAIDGLCGWNQCRREGE